LPRRLTRTELWRRLRASNRAELVDRARQEICKRYDLAQYHLRFPRRIEISRGKTEPAHFFFEPQQVPEIVALLRQRLPETAEQIVERADRICAHRFDLLGYTNLDYGAEIDWHCDKVHGKMAPPKPWYKIAYLDSNEVGDSKVIWELNRHQHLVTLAKAFRISGDARFAKEAVTQWYHWRSQNLYPMGMNWTSSLEVGIRSISWLWTKFLLQDCEPVSATFWADLLQQLAISGRHIERYLSTYFSPNTHLLGEGVALFFIGTLCPELKHARRWQRRGWEIVLQAAERQVLADGMYFERSTYYHVYAMDFLLHAGLLAARNDLPIPERFEGTIEKMAEALSLLSQAGTPAVFGDDDGGRVFDPQRNRLEHLLDPLATAAVVFAREDFKSVAGGLSEEAIWLLGAEGVTEFDQLPARPLRQHSQALETSGFYIMASAMPVPQKLVINAGGRSGQSAGHEHSDLLSIQVSAKGGALLIDSGTCDYAGAERDISRGTAAHNTLTIDRADQSEPKGPFSWKFQAQGKVEGWISRANFDLFAGSHNGYERLGSAIHKRFVFHRKSRFWLIRDAVEGTGQHYLQLSWHVAPGLTRHAGPDPIFLTADRTLGFGLVWAKDHGWAQVVGRKSFSPVYGCKQPATVLRLEREAALPSEFVTVLVPMFEAHMDLGVLTRADKADQSEPAVYVYAVADEEHRFLFSRTRPWIFADWTSDAEFVYWQAYGGHTTEIILCRGSYLEFRGQRVISAKSQVDCCEFRRDETAANPQAPGDSVALVVWPDYVAAASAETVGSRSESTRAF
jgi:Heparinase II/III N-terminus/Heparinase II/III-like protein